jgi:Adenosine deaminase
MQGGTLVRRDLRSLPKAHLHIHLDGAMRASTLHELAARDAIQVPEIRHYGSFKAFAETIGAAAEVINAEENVRRLVMEVIEDAQDDGVVWLELSVWPGFARGRLGAPEEVMALLLDAGRVPESNSSVALGWMLAANRNRGPGEAVELARLAARLADRGVVSFGLDGDEAASPPDAFQEAFSIAREAGLRRTPPRRGVTRGIQCAERAGSARRRPNSPRDPSGRGSEPPPAPRLIRYMPRRMPLEQRLPRRGAWDGVASAARAAARWSDVQPERR